LNGTRVDHHEASYEYEKLFKDQMLKVGRVEEGRFDWRRPDRLHTPRHPPQRFNNKFITFEEVRLAGRRFASLTLEDAAEADAMAKNNFLEGLDRVSCAKATSQAKAAKVEEAAAKRNGSRGNARSMEQQIALAKSSNVVVWI
jgi:hypothetical protein